MAIKTVDIKLEGFSLDRFMKKIDTSGDCWIWMANKSASGYGTFGISRKMSRAHRIMFILIYGPIPKGFHVMHSCNNPSCVNPDHLSAGNEKDNMGYAARQGRMAQKLTKDDVLKIRRLNLDGLTQRAIAKKFSIRHSVVHRIVKRKLWKHV